MNDNLLEQLQILLDKKACEEVILRYGRTLDWLDAEGQAECFWPDAKIDYGFFTGNASDWVPLVMGLEEASLHRWHASTSVMVQVSGDRARAESYGFTAGSSRLEDGALECHLFGGRYLDELERRSGQWRIVARTYIADWAHTMPNGLDAVIQDGFQLNVLNITARDHEAYRSM